MQSTGLPSFPSVCDVYPFLVVVVITLKSCGAQRGRLTIFPSATSVKMIVSRTLLSDGQKFAFSRKGKEVRHTNFLWISAVLKPGRSSDSGFSPNHRMLEFLVETSVPVLTIPELYRF